MRFAAQFYICCLFLPVVHQAVTHEAAQQRHFLLGFLLHACTHFEGFQVPTNSKPRTANRRAAHPQHPAEDASAGSAQGFTGAKGFTDNENTRQGAKKGRGSSSNHSGSKNRVTPQGFFAALPSRASTPARIHCRAFLR